MYHKTRNQWEYGTSYLDDICLRTSHAYNVCSLREVEVRSMIRYILVKLIKWLPHTTNHDRAAEEQDRLFRAVGSIQRRSKFTSIDCGGTSNYTDKTTELARRISDAEIQGQGKSVQVENTYGNSVRYQTRRDFPTDGKKYCYKLTTEERRRYIVRSTFLYGTSVTEGRTPSFSFT
ncbi:hypothetical protein DH2020_003723 [Rehmannia glutinosa]|uniref:Malectin-like domain-containing protein n=1 Tax=Rehmannia glutinosa TaxID=99300 RepID=A0ABR0XMF6_REHGL